MADPKPASPTGAPLVPAAVVPYLLALLAVAGIVASLAEGGVFGAQSPVIARIAEGAGVLLAALMGTTPGLRRAPTVEQLAAAKEQGDAAAAKVDSGPAAVDVLNRKVP